MTKSVKEKKRSSLGKFVSTYDEKYCDELVAHMEQGNSFGSFCAQIKISRVTGYRWIQSKPDFFEAKRVADELYQKWWEDIGRAAMVGKIKGFNAAVWIFSMKNRFNWTDKLESVESKEKRKIQSMTDKELMEEIAHIKKKHKQISKL